MITDQVNFVNQLFQNRNFFTGTFLYTPHTIFLNSCRSNNLIAPYREPFNALLTTEEIDYPFIVPLLRVLL